jgi:hypothetical protein
MSATIGKGQDVPTLIREAWGKHAAKHAARAALVPYETARNWLRARAVPSAATLLAMAERDERMAAALEARLHALRAARRDHGGAHVVPTGSGSAGAVDAQEQPAQVTR